jgi:hypothetical protein
MLSPAKLYRHVVRMWTDVSEKLISNSRVEHLQSKKPGFNGWTETSSHIRTARGLSQMMATFKELNICIIFPLRAIWSYINRLHSKYWQNSMKHISNAIENKKPHRPRYQGASLKELLEQWRHICGTCGTPCPSVRSSGRLLCCFSFLRRSVAALSDLKT